MNTNDEPRTAPGETGDLYARLNVSPDAATEVIAAAYKALMRGTHPDHAVDDADRARRETASKLLGEAHATLIDPVRRQRYDDERRRAQHFAEASRRAESSRRDRISDHDAVPGAGTRDAGTSFVPHPEPGPATRRRATSAYRANSRESSSTAHRAEDLREYDSLTPRIRYALWRSARSDPQWRQVRNAMLARRERRFKVPLAWFGVKGTPEHPVEPLVRWHPGVGAAIGAAAAALIAWWYAAAPLYATYLPAVAALFPEIGLVVVVSSVVTAGVLGAAWTSMFWPSICRFRHGRRRFAIRAVIAFFALLTAPVIALGFTLAGLAAVLIAAFSPRR